MSICVVGSGNLDIVARGGRLPARGETVMAHAVGRHLGGKGANQAVAAARAGSRARLLGRIGMDASGAWLASALDAHGVETGGLQRDAALASGEAFITVADDAENAIVVHAGANAALALPAPAAELLGDARVVLAQLETAIAPVADLFAAALPGCLRILNAAPALPQAAAMFPDCDILVVNETELASYAGAAEAGDLHAVVSLARSLRVHDGLAIVVTLGARGAVVIDAHGATHLSGRAARVVDTVGAGDCFCGVLAATLASGATLDAAASRANAAAALAVGRPGAAESMPTREEIDRALQAQPSRSAPIT